MREVTANAQNRPELDTRLRAEAGIRELSKDAQSPSACPTIRRMHRARERRQIAESFLFFFLFGISRIHSTSACGAQAYHAGRAAAGPRSIAWLTILATESRDRHCSTVTGPAAYRIRWCSCTKYGPEQRRALTPARLRRFAWERAGALPELARLTAGRPDEGAALESTIAMAWGYGENPTPARP